VPRFFSADSVWNAPLAAIAPLDPNSGAIVGNLLHQESTETLGLSTSGGPNLYTATASTPLVHVTLDEHDPALQVAFNAVPIPSNAQPSSGSDAHLAVYQPSTDTMWEFWHLSKQADGWHADWGGRMTHVTTDPGYYRNVQDPAGNILEQAVWGAPATSFPLMAGTMMLSELQAGNIPHALALSITSTCASVFAAPAQRTDGTVTGDPTCVPEGAHFRLDPNLNLASLHLPHFIYMMAVAAQKYGILINNKGDGFTFDEEDPTQYIAANGYNPYLGPENSPGTPGALYDQWPNVMLKDFPWSHLELLKMTLRTQPDPTTYTETP
jgi:hypothetical protein